MVCCDIAKCLFANGSTGKFPLINSIQIMGVGIIRPFQKLIQLVVFGRFCVPWPLVVRSMCYCMWNIVWETLITKWAPGKHLDIWLVQYNLSFWIFSKINGKYCNCIFLCVDELVCDWCKMVKLGFCKLFFGTYLGHWRIGAWLDRRPSMRWNYE